MAHGCGLKWTLLRPKIHRSTRCKRTGFVKTRHREACNGLSTTQWSSTLKPCFTNPCATVDSRSCAPCTVAGCWPSLCHYSPPSLDPVCSTLCSNCCNCLLARHWFYRIFYDTCNALYMDLGPWVDLIHCSLNQSEHLTTLPFDWAKLVYSVVYSVANRNPGVMRRILSK